jgi:hypothetical protein
MVRAQARVVHQDVEAAQRGGDTIDARVDA